MACHTRESNLSDFFSHENYSYPLAMPKFGKLNHINKSNTISVFGKLEPSQHSVPEFDAIIFDGAAVVQIVSPNLATILQKCVPQFLNA